MYAVVSVGEKWRSPERAEWRATLWRFTGNINMRAKMWVCRTLSEWVVAARCKQGMLCVVSLCYKFVKTAVKHCPSSIESFWGVIIYAIRRASHSHLATHRHLSLGSSFWLLPTLGRVILTELSWKVSRN